MPDQPPKQDDAAHCVLSNAFIGVFNEAVSRGYDYEFTASAVNAAAAAFTAFLLARSREIVTREDLNHLSDLYTLRMTDFLTEAFPSKLPPDLRSDPDNQNKK